MKKCIAFALTLIFLLIPFSNVAMADSYDECIYEHDGSDTPCSYHISSVTVSSLNQEGEQKIYGVHCLVINSLNIFLFFSTPR